MRKPIVFPSGRTISQLAKELGVSRCYIWKLIQGGYDEQGIINWFNRIVPYRKMQASRETASLTRRVVESVLKK